MTLADRTLAFDPSSASRRVDLGTTESLGLLGDFTIECWVKLSGQTPTSNGAGMHLVGIGDKAVLAPSQYDISVRLFGGFGHTTRLHPSIWYHFAVRFTKSTNEVAIFVNGVLGRAMSLTPSASVPSGAPAGANVRLGSTNTTTAGQRFDGHLAEVRFWGVARTESEIRADMFRHLSGREDGLAAYFPLDGLPGDTTTAARDAKVVLDPLTLEPAATQRPSGTITGATFVASDLPLQRSAGWSAPPQSVVVAEFTGQHGCITIPDAPSFSASAGQPLTVEAWVRPAGKNGPVHMFPVASKHSSGKGWELRAGGGQAGFLVAIDGAYHEIRAPLENNAWHLLSGVCGYGSLQLFVNGILVASKSVPKVGITPSPVALMIGGNAYWPDHRYAGQIAEVRIWGTARGPASSHEPWILATRLNENDGYLVALYRLQGDAQDARGKNHGTALGVLWSLSGPPLPQSPPEAVAVAASDDPATLPARNAAQITANAALQKSLEKEQADHKATKDEIAKLQKQIEERTEEITALTATERERAPREETLAAREARKKQLELERKALLNPPPLLLTDFMQKASDEVKRAREALAAGGGKLRLDAVDLSMRTVFEIRPEGGLEMRFPSLDELKGLSGGNLSVLDLDIEAPEPPSEAAAAIIVPSVAGYTETVARRKLGAASLRAEIAFQAVRGAGGHANRVVNQVPGPGTAVPKGSAVTLFIGRES